MFTAQAGYRWTSDELVQLSIGINKVLAAANSSVVPVNPNQEVREPTKLWDSLQRSHFCCGLYDKSEWFEYSPIPRVLPRSCCSVHEEIGNFAISHDETVAFCQKPGNLWQGTCMANLVNHTNLIKYTLIGASVLNLLLSVFSFTITCCSSTVARKKHSFSYADDSEEP